MIPQGHHIYFHTAFINHMMLSSLLKAQLEMNNRIKRAKRSSTQH